MRHGLSLFFAALGLIFGLSSVGFAQESIMKDCGNQWKAAKAANTVPAGQTWVQFLAECRTKSAANPSPVVSAPAAAPINATNPLKPATPVVVTPVDAAKPSGGREAMQARAKQCGAEWKANKAELIKQGYPTWPKYWSACNTRLKTKG
jgi:hypothetical protein